MPQIKFQHVVSFSSEEKGFSADNLLLADGLKKWRCLKGENKASVTFQLVKATEICQIDIANEGSAFVEVLVGRSSEKDEDMQVILVASSFMTPTESRQNQNLSRVRIFKHDDLNQAVLKDRWDRVKVVCTQPFNKTSPHGLALLTLHSPMSKDDPPASSAASSTPSQKVSLGAFKLKSDEGDIKTGSLFASRSKTPDPIPLTGAAAVRAASKLAEQTQKQALKDTPTHAPSPQAPKRKHSDDSSCQATSSKTTSSDTSHTERGSTGAKSESSKTPLRKQSTSLSSIASATPSRKDKDTGPPPMKKTKSEPPKPRKDVPFKQIMKKVTFVMSGFQNPTRGELRDDAMEMGAQYKPDWGKGCTHLICAFDNTPKYNQVKGKGRIVKKEWIRDCHKARKLLPWRKYRLGRARSPPDSSESDSEPEVELKKKTATPPPAKKSTSRKVPVVNYDDPTDSGDDTEDEIRRIKAAESKKTTAPVSAKVDIYGISTDEEMEPDTTNGRTSKGITKTAASNEINDRDDCDDDSDGELPPLPNFFSGKCFLLFGTLKSPERHLLSRYIIAYAGNLSEYMADKVDFVITSSAWDDTFDKAATENPSLNFVKPAWIYSCNDNQKLVPYQKYMVIP